MRFQIGTEDRVESIEVALERHFPRHADSANAQPLQGPNGETDPFSSSDFQDCVSQSQAEAGASGGG